MTYVSTTNLIFVSVAKECDSQGFYIEYNFVKQQPLFSTDESFNQNRLPRFYW